MEKMKRYIALLRGINISGKNRIPMTELKKGFEGLGFKEVKTYLNSGNVELENILHNAPDWWDDKDTEIYDNLIFIIPPATYDEVYSEIGEPKEELEMIAHYENVVFWSFHRKDYQKTNWWSKTASVSIGKKLTIRTANTIRKIVKM